MLINISTTTSFKDWPEAQRKAAEKDYSGVIDLPLDTNPVLLSKTADIQQAARSIADSVKRKAPVTGLDAAMRRPITNASVVVDIPGPLGYHAVSAILQYGYPVVAPFQVRRRGNAGGAEFGGFVPYTTPATRA
jgi:hypothetical protein